MSIREVSEPATVDTSKTQRMVRIIITDDNDIFAVWSVHRANGKRIERSVQVSAELRALILARVSYQNFLDNIETDTYPRIGS